VHGGQFLIFFNPVCNGMQGFFPSLGRLATSCKTQKLIPCSSSITSSSTRKMQNGGGKMHSALMSTWSRVPGPIQGYPWGQASVNFAWRLADLLWVTGKWLAIPVLLVSALSEVSYTLMQEKIFLIPAGMLGGFAFAGMVKETALEMCEALESVQVNSPFPSFACFRFWYPSLVCCGVTFHISSLFLSSA